MKLSLDIDPNTFISELVKHARDPHEPMSECLEKLVADNIIQTLQPFVQSGQFLNIQEKKHPYSNSKWKSFKEIILSDGYKLNYLRFVVNTPKDIELTEQDILQPTHLKWQPADYIRGVKWHIEFKKTAQKTKNKYEIEIFGQKITSDILRPVYKEHFNQCNCPDDLLSPIPIRHWWLRFGCKICGTRYFCECFRGALEKYKIIALKNKPTYAKGAWPDQFLSALEESKFKDNICHICTGKPSDMFFCHPMYGSIVRVKYGAYIKKVVIENDLDDREAENIIREKIGFPKIGEKWINETHLYHIVCALFPHQKVLREASPDWLEQQRLDIYLPDLKLAIEYQGQQHYQPVELFGGEEGLKKTKQRDSLKKSLCKSNDIDLVYFKHNENLTVKSVEKKLKKYMNDIPQSPFETTRD